MNNQTQMARDGEEFSFHDYGQDWIGSWHSPLLSPPDGTPHGSAAVCLTAERNVVLVSEDGQYWGFPGGRPESDEDWRTTLEREMLEEACAVVEEATLLGFSKGICVKGHEEGLILVRALWRADVSLRPWKPCHETIHRILVPPDTAMEKIYIPYGIHPIYQRWFYEALRTR